MEMETDVYTRALLKLGGPSKNKWQWRKVVLTSLCRLRYYDEKDVQDAHKGDLLVDGAFLEYVIDKTSATYKKLESYKRPSAPSSMTLATDIDTPGFFGLIEKGGNKTYYFCCQLSERQWWEETLKESIKGSHKLGDLIQIRKFGAPAQTSAAPPALKQTVSTNSIWSSSGNATANYSTMGAPVGVRPASGIPSQSTANFNHPSLQSKSSLGSLGYLPPGMVSVPSVAPSPTGTSPTADSKGSSEAKPLRKRAGHMSGILPAIRLSQEYQLDRHNPQHTAGQTAPMFEESILSLTLVQQEIDSKVGVERETPTSDAATSPESQMPSSEAAAPQPNQADLSLQQQAFLQYQQQLLQMQHFQLMVQMQQAQQDPGHYMHAQSAYHESMYQQPPQQSASNQDLNYEHSQAAETAVYEYSPPPFHPDHQSVEELPSPADQYDIASQEPFSPSTDTPSDIDIISSLNPVTDVAGAGGLVILTPEEEAQKLGDEQTRLLSILNQPNTSQQWTSTEIAEHSGEDGIADEQSRLLALLNQGNSNAIFHSAQANQDISPEQQIAEQERIFSMLQSAQIQEGKSRLSVLPQAPLEALPRARPVSIANLAFQMPEAHKDLAQQLVELQLSQVQHQMHRIEEAHAAHRAQTASNIQDQLAQQQFQAQQMQAQLMHMINTNPEMQRQYMQQQNQQVGQKVAAGVDPNFTFDAIE